MQLGLSASKLRTLAALLAGQHESTANATATHKRRQQTGWKLDGGSIIARRHNFVDDSTVVRQVLLGGDVQVENKSIHAQDVKGRSTGQSGLLPFSHMENWTSLAPHVA